MYLSVFYCSGFVNEISMEMVENQALEERYPELEEKEDVRISVAMEEHRKYVSWDNY